MKLIQRVKIARAFLIVMSELFHPIIFSLLVLRLTIKNFSKPTDKTGEIADFFIYSHFKLTMKVALSIQLNCRPTFKNDLFLV